MVTWKKDKRIFNIANGMSILRIILGPIFLILLLQERYLLAFIAVIAAALSDFLDGYLARILNLQTRIGKILDPLADKIFVFSAIIALVIRFEFPLWIATIFFLRDFLLVIIGGFYLLKNTRNELKPNLLGKTTTFFQMLAITLFIINLNTLLRDSIVYIAALLTVISGISYIIKGFKIFSRKDEIFKKKKWRINLPNKITILRVCLIPVFLAFLMSNLAYKETVAAIIFIVLALSDAVDGYIARKTNQITDFGKLLDPLADKLLVSSALIFLIGKGIDAWMAFVIIAREFAVTGLRMIALTKKITIPAKASGKIKTISQIIAIVAVLLGVPYAWYLMLISVIITIYSGIEYFWLGRHLIKELD